MLRLLQRLEGVPLLISEGKLRIITENVTLPLLLGQREHIPDVPSMSMATKKSYTSSSQKVAVINVFDSLVSKNASAGSGLTSYEAINKNINTVLSNGATDIVFYIDSPGGEVAGLFGLTDRIRSLAAEGVGTIGFSDGMATSAAYAILAACAKSYTTASSITGSIAAIMTHAETSKADSERGITYTILRSKEEKALGDSHTPLNEAAIGKFQTILASMDTLFNNDVVLSRPNLSIQAIIDMKGSEFMAEEALQLGLIDGIIPSLEAVFTETYSQTDIKGINMNLETLQAQLKASEETIASLQSQLAEAAITATTAERNRCLSLANNATTLHLGMDIALEHIKEGYSPELSLDSMTRLATKITELTATMASNGLSASLSGDASSDHVSSLASAYAAATGTKRK